MKKFALIFAMIAIVCVSCEEALLGLAFDYEYTFDAPIPGPLESDKVYTFKTEAIENNVSEELAQRQLKLLDKASIKDVSLSLDPEGTQDFSSLKFVNIYLVTDTEEILIASRENTTGGDFVDARTISLNLSSKANDVAFLLESPELVVKYEYELIETEETGFDIDVSMIAKVFGKI